MVEKADGRYDHFELQNNDDVTNDHVNAGYFQERDLQRKLQSDIRRYKLVGVGVGLLCAVLALLIIVIPVYLYRSHMAEREQLVTSYKQLPARVNNLTAVKDQLQSRFDQLKTSFDQLENMYNNVTEERDCLRRLCESPGWQKIDRSCYYISTEKKTWDQSRQWCRDRESDLLVIKSKEKQDLVASFNKRIWLGLTDSDREASFHWVDGTPLTTPTYWRPGEPHLESNKNPNAVLDCVEYYDGSVSGHTSGGWNDLRCSNTNYWMCERVVC